jgi:hypothetical protein
VRKPRLWPERIRVEAADRFRRRRPAAPRAMGSACRVELTNARIAAWGAERRGREMPAMCQEPTNGWAPATRDGGLGQTSCPLRSFRPSAPFRRHQSDSLRRRLQGAGPSASEQECPGCSGLHRKHKRGRLRRRARRVSGDELRWYRSRIWFVDARLGHRFPPTRCSTGSDRLRLVHGTSAQRLDRL